MLHVHVIIYMFIVYTLPDKDSEKFQYRAWGYTNMIDGFVVSQRRQTSDSERNIATHACTLCTGCACIYGSSDDSRQVNN